MLLGYLSFKCDTIIATYIACKCVCVYVCFATALMLYKYSIRVIAYKKVSIYCNLWIREPIIYSSRDCTPWIVFMKVERLCRWLVEIAVCMYGVCVCSLVYSFMNKEEWVISWSKPSPIKLWKQILLFCYTQWARKIARLYFLSAIYFYTIKSVDNAHCLLL